MRSLDWLKGKGSACRTQRHMAYAAVTTNTTLANTANKNASDCLFFLKEMEGSGITVGICESLSSLSLLGSGQLHFCEWLPRVPRAVAERFKAEVLCHLSARFMNVITASGTCPDSIFSGDPLQMAEIVRRVFHAFQEDLLCAAETRRLTNLEPGEYEALLGRFLEDQEVAFEGRKVQSELELAFRIWQEEKEESERFPLLTEPFLRVCRDFSGCATCCVAANEHRVSVAFSKKGERSLLEAAVRFKWFAKP